ncbi:MAG: hypothetical protein FWH14_07025 [Oscillospiraceae bacterium]|nr:hypothetical protein [Oscillospiraceae bacterium]
MYRTLLALPLGELSAATPTERAACRVRTPVRTVDTKTPTERAERVGMNSVHPQ